MTVRILIGDCVERMKELPDNSVDSVVCDPPYHLTSIVKRFGSENAAPAQVGKTGAYARASKGFMGQTWDGGDVAFQPETWAEVLRVLKPGGHLVAFSGTRTYHRMAVAIEDAGFEVRDMIAWHYGSGFPKSHDISKAIDRIKDWSLVEKLSEEIKRARSEAGLSLKEIGEATQTATEGQYGAWYHRGGHMFFETGRSLPSRPEWEQLRKVLPIRDAFAAVYDAAEREVVGQNDRKAGWFTSQDGHDITAPATDAAREWEGWGTALKPAMENICHAQKPWDLQGFCGILAQTILEALCRLPSLAKDADESSPLSQSVFAEGFGSAQWSAVAECNTPDDLFVLMGTLPSGSGLPLSLSIASLWLGILDGISIHASTFTTETASSLITDLRTLKSLLSRNTPESIALAATRLSGSNAVASPATGLFNALEARLRFTLELSALAPATLQEATSCQDEVASEYACLARKPLSEKSIAANVLKWGTGAINVDGCRIEAAAGDYAHPGNDGIEDKRAVYGKFDNGNQSPPSPLGRWPANLCHDGSDEVVAGFPETESGSRSGEYANGTFSSGTVSRDLIGDSGSAARFFYTAKASTDERGAFNNHPTVKPIALMRWLVRLVTPKGGTVLDPFMGSGSTLIAADAEQFNAIGCELSAEYAEIARRRVSEAAGMFADVSVEMTGPSTRAA